MTHWYRYQESLFDGGRLMLVLAEFSVLKTTLRGVWLDVYGRKRFVLKDARKRFACPTKEAALESYQARKRRHVKLLRAQLQRAEAALLLEPDGVMSLL